MNKKCTHKIHQNFPNMQIPPSQSHAQPFTLLPTGGIFSLKYLILKIRLNILITNRLLQIWLQRDGSFAIKKSLSAVLGLRSPTQLFYICIGKQKCFSRRKLWKIHRRTFFGESAEGLNLRHLPASNPQETRNEKKTDIYQTNPT